MNHLRNAVQKCYRAFSPKWRGHLLPKEILALRDLGIELQESDIEIAIYWKRKGISGSRWIEFEANKRFKVLKEGIDHAMSND